MDNEIYLLSLRFSKTYSFRIIMDGSQNICPIFGYFEYRKILRSVVIISLVGLFATKRAKWDKLWIP